MTMPTSDSPTAHDRPHATSRRQFVGSFAAASFALLGCGNGGESLFYEAGGGSARLTARPGNPSTNVAAGTYQITPTNLNDGVLIVPSGIAAGSPIPLVVALHGAGQGSVFSRNLLAAQAQARGFALLAPGARGLTWDVMTYKYSYDVTFIDTTLAWVFSKLRVDTARIILQGFSDGASYALGLSLANGDLFTRAVVNSPGFIPSSDSPAVGKPTYFFSHGKSDSILNIDGASRTIVPAMRKQNYDVTFVEFDGGHEIPPAILSQSLDWALR